MKNKIILIIVLLSLAFNEGYAQQVQLPSSAIDAGTLSGKFSYVDLQRTSSYNDGYVWHKFTLPNAGQVLISHCGSSISNASIYNTSALLYNSSGTLIMNSDEFDKGVGNMCGDNPRLAYMNQQLPAGTYYLKSQWYSSGDLVVSIENHADYENDGYSRESAIDVKSSNYDAFFYSNTRTTASYRKDKIYYKLTLPQPMELIISHCGSLVGTTKVILENASGMTLAESSTNSGSGFCFNPGQAYMKTNPLAPGVYYVVSTIASTIYGDIKTTIEGGYQEEKINFNLPSSCNYVFSVQPTIGSANVSTLGASKAIQSVQYYDGLGRFVQTVNVKATGDAASDLVTYQEYDTYGRESNAWLPVVAAANKGAFLNYNTFRGKVSASYPNESKPYAAPVYENSALNRVTEQYGAGQDWHNNSKSAKVSYLTNITGVDSLNCIRYEVADYATPVYTVKVKGYYATGALYVIRSQDEDGNASFEFKNKQGQLILTRQYTKEGSTKKFHDTYYLYDNRGNVKVVLPPLAADPLQNIAAGVVAGSRMDSLRYTSTNDLEKYAYYYKYDQRNRCIVKKLPGAEAIYYVYDKANRLIFTQDGESRAKGQWIFTLPDAVGRIVVTGTCKNALNHAANPLANTIVKATWAGTGGAYKGYSSNQSLTTPVVLSAQYYDTYNFLALTGFTSLGYVTPESGYGTRYTASSQSLLTGTYVAEAGGGSEQHCGALYYDSQGRLIQSQTTNHLAGIDSEFIGYNFSGQPLKTKTVHTASGKTTQTEYYVYTYDHAGRRTKTEHKLGAGTVSLTVLEENTYDEFGRLKTSKKGNLPASTYTYNVRSWMKSITGSLFSQTLYYNDSYAGNSVRYNGNISAMSWKVGSETLRGYRFGYDNLSRMNKAEYLVNGVANSNYTVPSISYDKHGNITALQRWGKTSSGYGLVDNLTLGYIGNQLNYVTDAAVKTPDVTAGLNDFKDASSATSGEYTYNKNGAMTKDLNKGISNIAYNSLDLPSQLTINGVTNSYKYAADGTKLRVSRGSEVVDYVGSKVYENGSLKRILVDGGYLEGGVYHFYIQDHQGNNRVVATGTGTVVQKNHYYPFGMTFGEVAASEQDKQAYKYNGKELDRKNGLNLYDYSARYMEPALGRFTTMDPMAEKHFNISPYAYVMNNPMRYIDPLGMDTITVNLNGQEINRISATGDDIIMANLDEILITAPSKKSSSNFLMIGMNYLGQGFSTHGGIQFTPSTSYRTGYFRTASGNLYSNEILKPLSNGKYVRGVQGLRYGQQYAMSRAKVPARIGSRLGHVTTLYSGYHFFSNPNIKNGFDTAAGIAGIFFWEFGVAYAVSSTYLDCVKNEITTVQENILNNKNPLSGVYNPTTGQYD